MSFSAGILLLLICCIGNAELWVILINRRHALPIRDQFLKKLRKLHDVAMVVVPLILVAYAGLPANGILNGGSFRGLSWAQQGLILVTAVGFFPFVVGVVRYHLRSLPDGVSQRTLKQLSPLDSSLPEEVRADMLGDASSFVRNFPGNQIWQLEVNEKRFVLDNVPKLKSNSDPSIRLAHFSDVHLIGKPGEAWQTMLFDELIQLQPDAFVFTGDLLDRMSWLEFVQKQFAKLVQHAPTYFILGNHDWHLEWQEIKDSLAATGAIDLSEKSRMVELNGHQVLIAGTEAPWIGDNPVVPERCEEQFRILLSHAPDQRNFAEANDFDMMLSGHNHGGQIVLPVVGPVYSPSRYGVLYAGGCFRHRRLMMHVSRGTGAKDPLRLRCRPEISLLHLSRKAMKKGSAAAPD